MKKSPKRKLRSRSSSDERRWEQSAAFFESTKSLKSLAFGRAMSAASKRKMLGPGKTHPISLRIPEEDLLALKEIAKANNRKYQQILVQALETFIDDYFKEAG